MPYTVFQKHMTAFSSISWTRIVRLQYILVQPRV